MTADEQKQRYLQWFPHSKIVEQDSKLLITLNIKKLVAVKIIEVRENKHYRVMTCLNVRRPSGLETFGNLTWDYTSIEEIAEGLNDFLNIYCYDKNLKLKKPGDLPVNFEWNKDEVIQLINKSIQLYERYAKQSPAK